MSQEYRRLDGKPSVLAFQVKREIIITTPDEKILARVGDWVITIAHGRNTGDQYVCMDEVFREKYAIAEPPGNPR